MMEQLRCLQFLAQQGLAIRGHMDKESNFRQLVERAEKTPTLKSFMLSSKYASHETINELKQEMYRESLNTLLTDTKNDVQHYAITVDKRQDCAVCLYDGYQLTMLSTKTSSECMTVPILMQNQ